MQYFSQVTGIRETEKGTDLILHIPEELVRSKIMKYRNNNVINAEIRIDDNRTITVEQRKKIFATIKDIANFTGNHPEDQRGQLLYDYCIQTGEMPFSLSNCSIVQANTFINHIIEFILKENIPLTDLAINRTDDIDKYLYWCIVYKRCAITGKEGADIHHCEGSRVGMGGNRKKISNKGRELMALSREWHNRVHQEGEEEIFKLYKIYGITLSDATLNELKISEADIF